MLGVAELLDFVALHAGKFQLRSKQVRFAALLEQGQGEPAAHDCKKCEAERFHGEDLSTGVKPSFRASGAGGSTARKTSLPPSWASGP